MTPCNVIDDGKILAGLAFSKRQISELADRIVENLNGDSVYVKEAAAILKLNAGVVVSLCKLGLIPAQQARGYARKGLLISGRSLQDFSANHVRAADLADKLKTNSTAVIQVLRTRGINPIITMRRDKHPQYIFRREDVKAVDWVQVRNDINARALQSMPTKTFNAIEAATLIGCPPERITILVENGLLKMKGTKQEEQTTDAIFTARSIMKYLQLFGGRTDLVSGKIAAKILNETSNTFHNSWVHSGRLKRFETAVKCGRLCYFLYDDIQEIAKLKSTTITSVETTQLLSVSHQHLSKLVNRGTLTPVSGPKIDGCGRNRYLRSAVEELIYRASTPKSSC
jgi:hypothetical protein